MTAVLHPARRRSRRGALLVGNLAFALVAAAAPPTALAGASSPKPPVARDAWSANILVGNQATFDSGVGGWDSDDGHVRVSRATKPTENGAGSLALTNLGGAPAMVVAQSGTSAAKWTPATAGSRWAGWVSVRSPTVRRDARATVTFLDAQGRALDHATAQAGTEASSGWQQLPTAVGIAPPRTAFVILQIAIAGVAPTETHYLDNAALISAPGGVPRVSGQLHTVGNQIVDSTGRAVIFRGVNRAGLEGSGGDDPTPDDIAHAQQWGANFVRVPLGEQFWMPSTCYYDSNYPARVDAAVDAITSRGMVALLNLHYNTLTSCGQYGLQPMADAPSALTFWKQVATRYKDNPLVAFDLYNEPHGISDTLWRYGGTLDWKGATITVAGMQQMYDAVRATGATNLVFVTGTSWGNLYPSTAPLAGVNIVYAVHAYTCPRSLPPDCTNSAPYDPSQVFRWWVTASQSYPVMVTEFGWPDPGEGRYIHNVIAYAELHGWSWAVYTWGDATFGPFDLLANAGPGANYEPRPAGMAALAGFAGS
ncbi:MAG: glycoside hydrolase family 5 protein [Actinomycetes bacterium]